MVFSIELNGVKRTGYPRLDTVRQSSTAVDINNYTPDVLLYNHARLFKFTK